MLLKRFDLLVLVLLLINSPLKSQQTRIELENERQKNLIKISEAEKILKETEKSKNVTTGKLNVINKQINNRLSLISNLKKEIKFQNNEILDLSAVIYSLTNDLKILKNEYSEMIYYSYKSRSSLDKLGYVFSSNSYNQMFRRLGYIVQYTNSRKKQIQEIEIVTNELDNQKNNLIHEKRIQNKLLSDEVIENNKLQKLQRNQKKTISDLGKKERRIKKEIKERRIALEQLDNLIKEVIRSEREKLSGVDLDLIKLTESFETNIGKLIWPVSSGFISNKFGVHPHPVIKNVKVKNDGIDIQTSKGSKVYSVFSGKVSTVAFIPGMNNVIIINHGDYYTLYAKLKNLVVEKGDIITIGQNIADIVTNSDGVSELQFQVWKNNIKLNPEKWIMKK
ncbi:MAG: peptidoglycan DD-metalloendopeptidase family protein [Bacteroidota bacterium]|nr:peptidoglycan DD-metalloendopeptidase family protein [Bacteroidota bacterium]